MSLRDLHRTTESKALYDGRLTVDLHYTERHGTTRHDTAQHDTTRQKPACICIYRRLIDKISENVFRDQ